MSKRKLIWHVGLAHASRAVVPANLLAHHDELAAAGVLVAASSEDARLATHELLRTHREAGLSRSDVDGRWARVCDRVWRHKGVSVISTPDLGVADKDQIRMALDPLKGVEVHLVLTLDGLSQQIYGGWLAELRAGGTTGWEKYADRMLAPTPGHPEAERFWAGHDLPSLVSRWGWTIRAERVHVVADRDVGEHWTQLLELLGAPATDPVLPAYADPAGVTVLRKVNRQLDQPLAVGTVELLTGVEREGSAMPVVPTSSLAPLMDSWAAELAAAGHDLRGDLASLVDDAGESSLPGRRDQLGAAVDALSEALAENSRLRLLAAQLERERDRLDRKRRQWKRRARAVSAR